MRLQFISPANGIHWSYLNPTHPQLLASKTSLSSSLCLISLTKRTKWNQLSFSSPFLSGSCYISKTPLKESCIKRPCSANLEGFFSEESIKHSEKLAHSEEEEDMNGSTTCTMSRANRLPGQYGRKMYSIRDSIWPSNFKFLEPMMLGIHPEPPEWPEREALLRTTVERKANSVELPVSLRMLKKKQQRRKGFQDLGDSAYCSVKKAFSSMLFIVLELQNGALQIRELLCYEDLEAIRSKVQSEVCSSFVWLFQQVFSQTPALMVYVMILLANFSLYSMTHSVAFAEPLLYKTTVELVSATEENIQQDLQIQDDKHIVRSSTSIQYPNIVPEDISGIGSQEFLNEEEMKLWNSMVNEASRTQFHSRDEFLHPPVSVELEPEDYVNYFSTDLMYQRGLSQDPNNPLLLCNYAQFLHLVAHDHDRAEECFKRAVRLQPPDAESLNKYANFLWIVRKDVWGAEERYLQAIAAEPDNTYYASQYAHFLWNTGGEETCFPSSISHNSKT